jgi:valyl-tRNA synthetase
MEKETQQPQQPQLDIHAIENKWQAWWEKEKIYRFDGKSKKKIFSIDTPPPTVSGRMHMGHAFGYILSDILARFKKMKGLEIFYPFGLDDNGIATNLMVEKNLGVRAKDYTREKWIEVAKKETEKTEEILIREFKSLGIACDWSLLYRTIDSYCTKQAQRSFIEIYNMQRAYRAEAPVLFCTHCETAISQVELQDKETESLFSNLFFDINGKKYAIATTRPEFLPACVAVFYNPDDKRYKILKGKKARVPLFDFEVPILEDKRVAPEKGTGLVMCCTFGDQTDMEWQKAYKLTIKEAISADGKMSKIAGKYQGMNVKEARAEILKDLAEKKLIEKQEKIKHIVNVHERCGRAVEIINTKQWFVKYLDLKKQFLEQAKKIDWHPEYMRTRYDNWVNGLQWDWCISRQKYFGVPIPAWYCKKCGAVILPEDNDLPVDPLQHKPKKKCKCGSMEFEPEKDTFDTWFISSLTPQIECQWKEDDKMFKKLFPMTLRPHAQEIISFWDFNTIVKAYLHNSSIPWQNVMIHGWILDPYGEKMAKSKGNIIMPYTMIEKYSADSMRYWASTISLGDNSAFQEKELVAGDRFIKKLWNASRFVFMNLKDYRQSKKSNPALTDLDKAMLSKLNSLSQEISSYLDKFNFTEAKRTLDQFFWHTFCDNYLEIIKDRFYNEKRKQEKEAAQHVLYKCLFDILKMNAPFMPHITEDIYQEHFKAYEKEKSIHLLEWPEFSKKLENKEAEKILDAFIPILSEVRQYKAKNQKSLKAEIILTLEKEKLKAIKPVLDDLKAVCNAKDIKEGKFEIKFL